RTDAGPPFELLPRLAHEHVQSTKRWTARHLGVPQQPRLLRFVNKVVDRSTSQILRRQRTVLRCWVHPDGRAVDEKVPAARGWRPAADRAVHQRSDIGVALTLSGVHVDASTLRRKSHGYRARRSSGAKKRRAKPLQRQPAGKRLQENAPVAAVAGQDVL